MGDYASMDDHDTPLSGKVLFSEKVFSKFCYFGFVGSNSWDITYVVVMDGVLRVYDSEETYNTNPENFVFQLPLSSNLLPSSIYLKNYSKDTSKDIMIHYIYVLKDNGLWSPTRMFKVGSSNRAAVDKLVNAIKQAVKHTSA
mmetsp:Transcript_25095/g.36999  ORF Transcript_25095/g.36999 Transcript_25095/m.36999 type:complete len:142 (-) Transcript_25095:143-568(-)|eukprot:CAMPEP_0185020108 /NCGR_PEP_ID=MMETSP1103-20130426/2702_1 /TAXON_ID=36769 /ORGANISM="Paraphysomonas bandaiensis, Strain Caron Lab Isolate" /LENGTH=141 /DNA_ID=CAMNT_0027550807 /DNA_START=53 /DNA_END=478 /DNA_ORIENTATION=-